MICVVLVTPCVPVVVCVVAFLVGCLLLIVCRSLVNVCYMCCGLLFVAFSFWLLFGVRCLLIVVLLFVGCLWVVVL